MRRDFDIRLTLAESEKLALRHLADVDGMSQAAVVRRLLRTEARERGLWPAPSPSPSSRPARPAAGKGGTG